MQGRMKDEVIEKLAKSQGPNDPFTGAAYFLQGILIISFLPLNLFLNSINGLIRFLNIITLETLLYFPQWGLLLINLFLSIISWLWLNVPLLRPVLIIPGLLVGTLGFVIVSFLPKFGDEDLRQITESIFKSWPHAYLIQELTEDFWDD